MTIKLRTFLMTGIGIAVLALVLWDRARINTRNERAKVEAKEDAMRRQMAVVSQNRASLIAGIYDKLREDTNTLDVALFISSTDVLNTLWKYEKQIDQAQLERATVTAKRLLDALGCKEPDAFFEFARRKMTAFAALKGLEEDTNEYFFVFLGLESSEEFDQFQAFISRACADIVFDGDDLESRMKNAPRGIYRLF